MYGLLIAGADPADRQSAAALVHNLAPSMPVWQAGSYDEALAMILHLRPQAALIPLRLSARSGCSLTETVRAAGLDTAVCITSSSVEPESIRRAMRAGAQDYLLTPLNSQELSAFLRRAFPGTGQAILPSEDPILHVKYASLSPLTVRLLRIVQEDFNNPPVTLLSISERLNMNSKYLGRVFLRDTGMKLSQYVLCCRMEEARRLIETTSEKISVIAGMVGYGQLNRFYVHFQSYFGLSPSALRRAGTADTSREVRA